MPRPDGAVVSSTVAAFVGTVTRHRWVMGSALVQLADSVGCLELRKQTMHKIVY